MQLSVMLFASYADAFGRDRLQVDLADDARVEDLVNAVLAHAEGARLPPRPMVAVNRRHAEYSQPLATHDEVAVIPPVAGG
jgi:molybdopterin converting factor subunit 1